MNLKDSYKINLGHESKFESFNGQAKVYTGKDYTFTKIDTLDLIFEKGKTYSLKVDYKHLDITKTFYTINEAEIYYNSCRESVCNEYKPPMNEGGRLLTIGLSTIGILGIIIVIAFASL